MRPLKPLNPATPATSATSGPKPLEMHDVSGRSPLRPVATSAPAAAQVATGRRTHMQPVGSKVSALTAAQVAEVAEVAALGGASLPGDRCALCGSSSYVRPPSGSWRCSSCEPVTPPPAHEQAGWAFCAVPGGEAIARAPLPYPPSWQGWPDGKPRQPTLPDLATAPIGKCAGCRFTAPLTVEGLCGRCTWDRAR